MAIETSNPVIEQAVLGSFFMWWKQLRGYMVQLCSADFPVYHKLYSVLCSAYRSGREYDEVLLLTDAQAAGVLQEAIDAASSVITVLDFPKYLERLMEVSQKRRLHDQIFSLYQSGEINIEALEGIVEGEKQKQSNADGRETMERRVEAYLNNLGKKEERIYTGFPMMDKVLGGFRRGTVCHIGARPSTGKTAFAINIASHQKTKRVLFFSLEMSTDMILDRYAADVAGVEYGHFTSQDLSEDQMGKVRKAVGGLGRDKWFFIVDDIYNVEAMASAVLRIRPDLVVVDYIQKVTALRNYNNMRERVEYISGELKKIAKTNHCAILCLSQLSRDGQNAPTMSNLKESGALEADGDYIILLHRPFVLDKREDVSPETTEVLLDKNKFGETGIVNMRFLGQYQRFIEVDERYDDRLGDL